MWDHREDRIELLFNRFPFAIEKPNPAITDTVFIADKHGKTASIDIDNGILILYKHIVEEILIQNTSFINDGVICVFFF